MDFFGREMMNAKVIFDVILMNVTRYTYLHSGSVCSKAHKLDAAWKVTKKQCIHIYPKL